MQLSLETSYMLLILLKQHHGQPNEPPSFEPTPQQRSLHILMLQALLLDPVNPKRAYASKAPFTYT
jgi:hypothetical protein